MNQMQSGGGGGGGVCVCSGGGGNPGISTGPGISLLPIPGPLVLSNKDTT